MDFPFLHFCHMLTVKQIKETMEIAVCEANIKLSNGSFNKKDGEVFRKTLTDQLDVLPNNEDIKLTLFLQLESLNRLNYGSDVSTYLGIIRYIFSALSLVDFICKFTDKAKPEIHIKGYCGELFNKTIPKLIEKLITTKTIKKHRETMREFYGIAMEAYKKGHDAASYFISIQLSELMSKCGEVMDINMNRFSADLLILITKSLDIVKFTDDVLEVSKKKYFINVDFLAHGLPAHQQAQMLQLQAEAYSVKDIFSLAIQRGKEARDMFQTDIDKAYMKQFVERMEIKQLQRDKDRKPETKTKVRIDEESEVDSEVDLQNKIVVLDDYMEPMVKKAEEQVMKGIFDIHAAKQFHEDIRKYMMDRKQRDEGCGAPTCAIIKFRVMQGLENMFENLFEDQQVWLGMLRYIFHVISLVDSACELNGSATDKPLIEINFMFPEVYMSYFGKISLKGMTFQEVIIYLEELMEIARHALEYGHKYCCFFITDAIVRLYTANVHSTDEKTTFLQDLFILHLGSVDIELFPDYMINVCKAALALPYATRKQKGLLHEYECRALKYKKDYRQAIQRAQLSKASFQDREDKLRVEDLIKDLGNLDLLSNA